jgi:hypothetical protein
MFSLLEMMVCGMKKWMHTRSKKILVVYVSVMFFLQVVRMAIFENQSMTTNTQ